MAVANNFLHLLEQKQKAAEEAKKSPQPTPEPVDESKSIKQTVPQKIK